MLAYDQSLSMMSNLSQSLNPSSKHSIDLVISLEQKKQALEAMANQNMCLLKSTTTQIKNLLDLKQLEQQQSKKEIYLNLRAFQKSVKMNVMDILKENLPKVRQHELKVIYACLAARMQALQENIFPHNPIKKDKALLYLHSLEFMTNSMKKELHHVQNLSKFMTAMEANQRRVIQGRVTHGRGNGLNGINGDEGGYGNYFVMYRDKLEQKVEKLEGFAIKTTKPKIRINLKVPNCNSSPNYNYLSTSTPNQADKDNHWMASDSLSPSISLSNDKEKDKEKEKEKNKEKEKDKEKENGQSAPLKNARINYTLTTCNEQEQYQQQVPSSPSPKVRTITRKSHQERVQQQLRGQLQLLKSSYMQQQSQHQRIQSLFLEVSHRVMHRVYGRDLECYKEQIHLCLQSIFQELRHMRINNNQRCLGGCAHSQQANSELTAKAAIRARSLNRSAYHNGSRDGTNNNTNNNSTHTNTNTHSNNNNNTHSNSNNKTSNESVHNGDRRGAVSNLSRHRNNSSNILKRNKLLMCRQLYHKTTSGTPWIGRD